LKADHACFSFEENAEDILVPKIDVLGIPTNDDGVGDLIAKAPLYYTPDEPIVS
jgi:hypothetical protein